MAFAQGWFRSREVGVVVAALVIFLLLSMATDRFLTSSNLLTVARQISLLAIIAVGMTYLIIAGELDLSVGSVYGAAGIVMGLLIKSWGFDPWLAMLVTLLFGGAVGLFNGLVTTRIGIPSFVVTLGMLSVMRGAALLASGGWPISGFPRTSFFDWTGGFLRGTQIPMMVIWMAVIMLVGGWVLAKTKFGYHVYATGGNVLAAARAGIDTNRVKVICFVMTGILAALASCLYIGFFRSAQPLAGQGLELQVIAAVIIGGTNLFGGMGSVFGTFIGAAITGMIRNGLVLLGVEAYWQEIVIGFIIILAVVLDITIRKRQQEVVGPSAS